MGLVNALLVVVRAALVSRTRLAVENLALRQQLAVFKRAAKRPRLRRGNRIFWSWLSRAWPGWRSAVIIVKPETVIRWHRLRRAIHRLGSSGVSRSYDRAR